MAKSTLLFKEKVIEALPLPRGETCLGHSMGKAVCQQVPQLRRVWEIVSRNDFRKRV
jgi:hypothetical protein